MSKHMEFTYQEILKSELKKINVIYVYINDTTSFTKIYNLFLNNVKFKPTNGTEYNYLGLYFKNIKKDYDKAKCSYLMAMNEGNINAIHNLANLCIELIDYYDAEHYFLEAIRHNNTNSFNGLAWFYDNIKNNFVNAEIYYKIAVGHNITSAMHNLACFYYSRNNFVDFEFYSLLAIKNGNMRIMIKLMSYYENIKNIVGLMKLFTKHHNFIERIKIIDYIKKIWNTELNLDQNRQLVKILLSFKFLMDDDIPTSLKIFAKVLKNKTTIIKLHFDYTINSQGFHHAKKDFNDRSLCDN